MSLTDRCSWYIDAQRRARHFGVPFLRRKSFAVPQCVTVNGARISIQSPREHGSWVDFIEIFLSDCYYLERLRNLDGGIQRILDIGANCGWFSVAARAHFPRAAVHAYEPNPAIVPFLRHNVHELSIVVHPEAVAAQNGTVKLVCNEESNTGRTIRGEGTRCVSFGAAIERLGGSADMVKLDCEGAEWQMFDDPAAWAAVRWLTMEYHLWAQSHMTHQDVAEALVWLGFDIQNQRPTGRCGLLLASKPMI